MKILLGDFNAKVGREDIFKPTVGNSVFKKYGSYHSCSSNGTPLINLMILKGHFKLLSLYCSNNYCFEH
jgi:hypothetical protein